MQETHVVQKLLERALACAYAALDETTVQRVAEARTRAAEVLPKIRRLKPPAFTLGEGRQLIESVSHVRAALEVLDRRMKALTVS